LILTTISQIFSFTPLVLYFWFKTYRNRGSLNPLILLYFGLLTLTELSCKILASFQIHNIFILNFFSLTTGLILIRYFKNNLGLKKYLIVFDIISIVILVEFLYKFLFSNILTDFDNELRTIVNITIVIMSISFIMKSGFSIIHNQEIIFNFAFLFYFSTSLIISLFSNYLINAASKSVYDDLWVLQLSINIITNTIFCVGIWRSHKHLSSTT
jgi:hypothetical protein